jgi:hypothetical protein
MEREYDPYLDENYGKRNYGPITYSDPWLRVYFEKLAKNWPANMAAVAANKQARLNATAQS